MSAKEQLDKIRRENRRFFKEKMKALGGPVEHPITVESAFKPRPWICCFDLETTNLHANFVGVILCGVIKPWGEPAKVFRGDHYDTWENKRSDDSQIAVDIYNELLKYRVWVAHNGLNFDINFLRSRLGKAGIQMPQPKNIDPVRLARRFLRFKFNSLEAVGEHFGFSGKTKVEQTLWTKCALDGDREALDYIVDHCVADVELLEKVTDKLDYLAPKITAQGSDF